MAALTLDGSYFPSQVRDTCNVTPNTWRQVNLEGGTTEITIRNPSAATADLIYSFKQDLVEDAAVDLAADDAEELDIKEFISVNIYPGQVTEKRAITKVFVASSVASAPIVVIWNKQQQRLGA